MSSILKVDTIQDQNGNNIISENANTITIGASGDTISIPAGATLVNSGTATGFGLTWQSVQTTGFTAVKGNAYPCNTTSAEFTVTLPATPSAGDQVQLVDYAGTFDTNQLIINPNGNKLESGTDNLVLKGEREGVILTYIDSTQGWIATSGINEGTDALEPNVYSVDFLVIAGGGGGGGGKDDGFGGGGGGAGGYRTSTGTSGGGGSAEAILTFNPGTVYTITVGAGGAGATNANGVAGSNSSISGTGISTITSSGGGLGGGGTAGSGGSGGSGGGSVPNAAGGSGTANQGFNGGVGSPGQGIGGGGGGAGAVGVDANQGTATAGNGGAGVASSITGSSVTRAGGGGAGIGDSFTAGNGGSGGGGNGANASGTATVGTINTGSGGGAEGGGAAGSGNHGVGRAGGSGVVILSMPDANYTGTTTGSPTVATGVSGKTVLTFTGSGSYTG
jgi:hypothetical protein